MKWLEALGLSVLAIFAPIKAVMFATGFMILADFVTGMWAAKKRGEKITSKGFSRTLAKIFLYEAALAVSFIVHQYLTGDALPADKLVAALVGLTELKSILENLDSINGTSTFKLIVDKIISAEQQKFPPQPPQGPQQ